MRTEEKINISTEPVKKGSYVETYHDLNKSQYHAPVNSSLKNSTKLPAIVCLFSDLPSKICEKMCWLANFTSGS